MKPMPGQHVDDHVLHPDHGSRQAREHLQLGVDQQRRNAFDILARQRRCAAGDAVEESFFGQEPSDRAEHAVFGHGVGVLVGVGHAGEELHVCVARRLFPNPVTNLCDAVVGGAHERRHAVVVGEVEHLHDGVEVLETNLLGACLLLGHVVHAEELVVAEEESVHPDGRFRAPTFAQNHRGIHIGDQIADYLAHLNGLFVMPAMRARSGVKQL